MCLDYTDVGFLMNEYSLVLHDANPTGPPTIAGTKPDVINVRKSNFDGKMGPKTVWIRKFLLKPCSKFEEASACILVRNGPFRRMLWILQ